MELILNTFGVSLNRDNEAFKRDLAEVQSLYDNHDSIIVCPVSTDILKCMKVIGQSVNFDVIMHTKNTLFF